MQKIIKCEMDNIVKCMYVSLEVADEILSDLHRLKNHPSMHNELVIESQYSVLELMIPNDTMLIGCTLDLNNFKLYDWSMEAFNESSLKTKRPVYLGCSYGLRYTETSIRIVVTLKTLLILIDHLHVIANEVPLLHNLGLEEHEILEYVLTMIQSH